MGPLIAKPKPFLPSGVPLKKKKKNHRCPILPKVGLRSDTTLCHQKLRIRLSMWKIGHQTKFKKYFLNFLMINSWDISRNVLHVLQNSQTSDSLHIIKKNENKQFGQISIVVFFTGISALRINFLKTRNLNKEEQWGFEKKKFVLSDLTPDVRSYPVLRYLLYL